MAPSSPAASPSTPLRPPTPRQASGGARRCDHAGRAGLRGGRLVPRGPEARGGAPARAASGADQRGRPARRGAGQEAVDAAVAAGASMVVVGDEGAGGAGMEL
ncbi:hypothetical protein CLOP_g21821, partial [Closterium sp. NIES-67]